jgi:hypothetical protein
MTGFSDQGTNFSTESEKLYKPILLVLAPIEN